MTKRKMRRLIKSGAIHPIALVREQIVESAISHPLWKNDNLQLPFPPARTLFDIVAHVCQKNFLSLGISDKHYYTLLAKVEIAVFGKPNAERK